MVDYYVTGELRDTVICRVDKDDSYLFCFGYVVHHTSNQYAADDWFSTSLIETIETIDDKYKITTLNSIYLVDGVDFIDIPSTAITNIRMGTPPLKALDLLICR